MDNVFLGAVVPVGGTREGDKGRVPLVPGDSCVDPHSGFRVRVASGFVSGNESRFSSGGYQTLLDNKTLAVEARLLNTLRQYHGSVAGRPLRFVSKFLMFSLKERRYIYLVALF